MVLLAVLPRYRGHARPVWLASWSESVGGTEDQDAFHTRAEAIEWAERAADGEPVKWERHTHEDGRFAYLTATIHDE